MNYDMNSIEADQMKFCGKCGSKIDEQTGLCPNCNIVGQGDKIDVISNEKSNSLSLKLLLTLGSLIFILVSVFVLDYFEVIGTGMCKTLGLISSGSFEIYSDTEYIFTTENDKYNVSFYCQPNVEFTSIELYSKDTDSKTASFYDDGQLLANGDLKAEDGFYSSLIHIIEKDEKNLKFYAVIKDGLRYYESNTITISVQNDWTEEQIQNTQIVDDEIQSLLKKDEYIEKNVDEKSKAVNELLIEFSQKETPLVLKDSICYDELSQIYSFQYADGTLGAVELKSEPIDNMILGNSSSMVNTNTKTDKDIDSNVSSQAVIMYDWYTDNDDILDFYEEYQDEWEAKGLGTDLSINPTVEDYKTQLANRELVLIAAHGSRYPLKSGLFNETTYSVICTHEQTNKELNKKYKYDIKQKNIVAVNTEHGKVYWMLPSFFSTHYDNGELDGSIMLINSCLGFGENEDIDYDLAGSMNGAGAVVGFHNSVGIFWNYKLSSKNLHTKSYGTLCMESIVDNLIKSDDIGTAFGKATNLLGDNQYQYINNYGYSEVYTNCCGYDELENTKQVYPLIVGTATTKLSISNNYNEYKTGNRLLKIGDKYICSDGEAIYYKNSITEQGKKIAGKNNGKLLSDGNVLYFAQEASSVISEFVACNVYSVNVDGSGLKNIFYTDGSIDMISVVDSNLIYTDTTDYAQHDIFRSYNLTTGEKSNIQNLNLDEYGEYYINSYEFLNNKLYLLLHNSEQTNNDCLLSYNFDNKKSDIVLSGNNIIYSNNNPNESNLHYLSYVNNQKKQTHDDCYIYSINMDGKITKTPQIASYLTELCIINNDASYALFYSRTYDDNMSTDFNLYKFDMATGKVTTIKNGAGGFKNKGSGLTYDIENPDDIYISNLAKFTGNGFIKYDCDLFKSNTFNNYDYRWIVGDFLVDSKLVCYEIKKEN